MSVTRCCRFYASVVLRLVLVSATRCWSCCCWCYDWFSCLPPGAGAAAAVGVTIGSRVCHQVLELLLLLVLRLVLVSATRCCSCCCCWCYDWFSCLPPGAGAAAAVGVTIGSRVCHQVLELLLLLVLRSVLVSATRCWSCCCCWCYDRFSCLPPGAGAAAAVGVTIGSRVCHQVLELLLLLVLRSVLVSATRCWSCCCCWCYDWFSCLPPGAGAAAAVGVTIGSRVCHQVLELLLLLLVLRLVLVSATRCWSCCCCCWCYDWFSCLPPGAGAAAAGVTRVSSWQRGEVEASVASDHRLRPAPPLQATGQLREQSPSFSDWFTSVMHCYDR